MVEERKKKQLLIFDIQKNTCLVGLKLKEKYFQIIIGYTGKSRKGDTMKLDQYTKTEWEKYG